MAKISTTQEANIVYKTLDHEMFKIIDGNRSVNKLHLNRLKDSIQKNNLTHASPIVVNEMYEIIDGQHRFICCRELGLPVYFIKIKGLRINDVQTLNANMKNWNSDDYMNAYADMGLTDYVIFRDFKSKYNFGHQESISLLRGNKNLPGGKVFHEFMSGTFKVDSIKKAEKMADMIYDFKPFYSGFKRRSFILACIKMFEVKGYNHSVMLDKLQYLSTRLVDCVKIEDYLMLLEDIYNFKGRGGKTRFM